MNRKFKSRRVLLENKLKLELAKSSPSLSEILKHIDIYEKDNLTTIDRLRKERHVDSKKITGALRQCITAHGPITKLLIGSATKRILGALTVTKPKETPIKQTLLKRIINWIKK